MATIEQSNDAKVKLDIVLKRFSELDPESLQRTDLGEKLSFKAGMPFFNRAIDLYRALLDCDIKILSCSKMVAITTAANELLGFFDQIVALDALTQNGLAQVRDDLINNVFNHWDQDFDAVSPVLAYSTKSSADFQRLEREAKGTLVDLNKVRTDVDSKVEAILEKMNGALTEVRDAAKEAGVSKHSVHFQEEAAYFAKSAWIWLFATVLFGGATLLYVVMHLEPTPANLDNPNWQQLVHHSIPRIIVLFVLSFGLVWCAKNYMAASHNLVVNRHRRNALASFQAFVQGSSLDETKDAVLLQATHAIFTPQDSGFAKGEFTPNVAGQVIEIVRGGAKSKGE